MSELCTDNRFELIEKYKQKLIDGTNIEMAPDEMAVIDDILFRFWQMDWLDKLDAVDAQTEPLTNADRIRAMTDEELAQHLCFWDNSALHASSERWLEWLKEEVDNEDD